MTKLIAPTLLALVALVGDALAQTTTQPARRPEATTPGQPARPASAAANLDDQIAACLVLGNQEEIALAQFAQQRAQSEQVKEFAQMMIEQHQQAVSKIQQAAPAIQNWNLKLAANATRRAPGATTRPAGAQPGAQPTATGAGAEQPMLAFVRRAHEECLKLTQQELGQKQGAEFDKAYMAHACFSHVGALAKVRASQEFASEKLQSVLQEGEQMTQKHLDHAKQIKEQLKRETGARQTTLKPETPGTPATTEPARRP